MASAVYWMDGEWPGSLAIGLRPRGGDWLARDVEAWRSEGVQVVVSLLEPQEQHELGLEGEPQACERLGLEYCALPLPDRGLPANVAPVNALAQRLAQDLLAGRGVLVHCRQGIGRSAMLAAAVLMVLGTAPPEALGEVERARGRAVPDTPEQREWILGFGEVHETLRDLEDRSRPRAPWLTRPAGGAVRGG